MQCERRFILDGVIQNCRNDGRETLMSRHLIHSTGTEVLAAGSSSLGLELSSPHIITGCKAEISSLPSITLNIETPGKSTIQTREYTSHLCSVLDTLILKYFNTKQLEIVEGRKGWRLYIDVVVLDPQASNLVEHISFGILLALMNTKIPDVEGYYNPNIDEVILELTNSYRSLDTSTLPVIITVNQIADCFVIDLTKEEEASTEGGLHISVNRGQETCGVLTASPGTLSFPLISTCLDIARTAATQVFSALDSPAIVYHLT